MCIPAFAKYLWAAPCTAVGVVLGTPLLCAGASIRLQAGVVEIAFNGKGRGIAGLLDRLPFSAVTFGHVVLAVTHKEHARLREHERVHVRQYEVWGPLLFLLYPASSLFQVLRGRHAYYDNCFEIQAHAVQGCQETVEHKRDA